MKTSGDRILLSNSTKVRACEKLGGARRNFGRWVWALVGTLASSGTVLAADEPVKIRIDLDEVNPADSSGFIIVENEAPARFSVGYGRDGVLPEGASFKGGYSLLGKFRVNAILTKHGFEMAPELVASSGKDEAYLRKHLFANMSSIDFDGDGKGGEYGAAFIGLEPLSDAKQPFAFAPYEGVFRWYSYAIHGTQDEARIGKRITGGCINIGSQDLQQLLARVKLGDVVEIRTKANQERL